MRLLDVPPAGIGGRPRGALHDPPQDLMITRVQGPKVVARPEAQTIQIRLHRARIGPQDLGGRDQNRPAWGITPHSLIVFHMARIDAEEARRTQTFGPPGAVQKTREFRKRHGHRQGVTLQERHIQDRNGIPDIFGLHALGHDVDTQAAGQIAHGAGERDPLRLLLQGPDKPRIQLDLVDRKILQTQQRRIEAAYVV